MNKITLSSLSDTKLDKYLEDHRDLTPKDLNCIWNTSEHTGSTPTTWQRFKTHCINCKFKADHKTTINLKDVEMLYPVFRDDGEDYRYGLNLMDMCYEFHVDRLKPGFEQYDNRTLKLLIKFFTVYCNMGKEGHQQSVQYSSNRYSQVNWKLKKDEKSEYITLTNYEMFHYFKDEFQPLLKANLKFMNDHSSYNFWYYMVHGKRSSGDQAYRDMVRKANIYTGNETRIVGPHKIGPKGEIIFTK